MTATVPTLHDIAGQLAGYDPQALRADTVNQFLASLVQRVTAAESLPLKDAFGKVLARDVISPINVPPHDNSAMDGFAFDGAALQDQPLALEVVGTALAGAPWGGQVSSGQCIKIMTGAVMPAGLDTVVPQELARVIDGRVAIPAGVLKRGDNRRFKGEDLEQGKPALRAGTCITPAALGLLASVGIARVEVLRPLRVAYFSTGDEILSLGEPPREGAVYDSNRFTLFGLLTRMGVELLDMGVVKDDPLLLEAAFLHASEQADAIITSGGVSVGEADHTKAIMRKLAGGDSGVAFWKIAMRPGRPMAVGRIGNAVLFGLPGNPVAVMVTFLAFVRPALLQMMGCTPQPLPLLQAKSTEAIRKKPGRTEYQRGTVTTSPQGELQVQTTGQQGSGVLSSMAQANGLIVLHHDQGNVAVGDPVDVMMFYGVI
jgi:molybdopterin molybdotransferase